MDARQETAVSVLAHELELANIRIAEDAAFVINFAALAPFARPDELPPLPRFVRRVSPKGPPGKTGPVQTPPRGIPYPRSRSDIPEV